MQASSAIEFIDPSDISTWSEDKIDKMLEQIRERRLRALRVYQHAQAEKEAAAYDKASESLTKQLSLLEGNISRVDKTLEALDKRINNVRALLLQMGRPLE